MKVTFAQKGDFTKTLRFLKEMRRINEKERQVLERYGEEGVRALAQATPVRTGLTADSWVYVISSNDTSTTVEFQNSNVNKGANIAIILQYGHGTRNGGYVQGRDYINPAIQPVFDKIAEEAWKEVNQL